MSTQLYFAVCSNQEVLKYTFSSWDWEGKPLNLLVAFPFLKTWRGATSGEEEWKPKSLMLDSGAYSAWKSGATIDIDALCEEAANPDWDEIGRAHV